MDMKSIRVLAAVSALALAPAAMAQKWEFGGGVGGSIYPSNSVTNGSASADVKTQTNIAGGLWLANDINDHWGGEVRIDYTRGDLQLSSGGTQATFNSEAYALHYDFQYHFANREARLRPYVAAGGGIKYYRGIGSEVLFQPLSQFALLTKTTQLEPLISVGAGLKLKVTDHIGLRLEVHDYLTPFPKEIVTPNTGSKISGWMQDLVPMVGLSYLF
jgi:opacity protein-like surface antigen